MQHDISLKITLCKICINLSYIDSLSQFKRYVNVYIRCWFKRFVDL